jgi:hypothetical protein
MEKKKSSIVKIMRALHRDIGFLLIGIMVIYALSGIQLNYRNLFTYSTETETTLTPNMSLTELASQLRMRDTRGATTEGDITTFTDGSTYNASTGKAVTVRDTVIWPIDKFNALHKNGGRGISKIITTIAAAMLFFLAISSFWMYPTKNRNFKRGIILAVVGFAIAIYLLSANQAGQPPMDGQGGQQGGPPQMQQEGGMPQMPQGGMPGGE